MKADYNLSKKLRKIGLKRCYMCRQILPFSDFYRDYGRTGGLFRRCKKCNRERDRKEPNYREKRKEITMRSRKKYPEKHKARVLFRLALRRGDIKKKPCKTCGNEKSEGHHPDYSKPLKVVWLCKKHHMELHHKIFLSKLSHIRKGKGIRG